MHIGKLPAALPLLIDEFGLSLSQSGDLVSIYALLIAGGALLLGILVSRIGYIPFAIASLLLCVIGSVLGMIANDKSVLMISRTCEGFGWIVGVVAFPSLLNALSAAKDKAVVLGIWGAFMPIGGGSILLAAPLLQSIGGWRLVWGLSTLLSCAGLIATVIICRRFSTYFVSLGKNRLRTSLSDLYKPEAIAILLCFFVYSFLFVALTSFLPVLLVEDSKVSLGVAIYWAALVMISNASGNISAGWISKSGLTRTQILSYASLGMGVLGLLVFSISVPSFRIATAILFAAVGGIIPGTLFATAPQVASHAARVGIIVGFMLTGTGIGQLTGPLVLSRAVDWSGQWVAGGIVCLVVGMAGALFARGLRNLH